MKLNLYKKIELDKQSTAESRVYNILTILTYSLSILEVLLYINLVVSLYQLDTIKLVFAICWCGIFLIAVCSTYLSNKIMYIEEYLEFTYLVIGCGVGVLVNIIYLLL